MLQLLGSIFLPSSLYALGTDVSPFSREKEIRLSIMCEAKACWRPFLLRALFPHSLVPLCARSLESVL